MVSLMANRVKILYLCFSSALVKICFILLLIWPCLSLLRMSLAIFHVLALTFAKAVALARDSFMYKLTGKLNLDEFFNYDTLMSIMNQCIERGVPVSLIDLVVGFLVVGIIRLVYDQMTGGSDELSVSAREIVSSYNRPDMRFIYRKNVRGVFSYKLFFKNIIVIGMDDVAEMRNNPDKFKFKLEHERFHGLNFDSLFRVTLETAKYFLIGLFVVKTCVVQAIVIGSAVYFEKPAQAFLCSIIVMLEFLIILKVRDLLSFFYYVLELLADKYAFLRLGHDANVFSISDNASKNHPAPYARKLSLMLSSVGVDFGPFFIFFYFVNGYVETLFSLVLFLVLVVSSYFRLFYISKKYLWLLILHAAASTSLIAVQTNYSGQDAGFGTFNVLIFMFLVIKCIWKPVFPIKYSTVKRRLKVGSISFLVANFLVGTTQLSIFSGALLGFVFPSGRNITDFIIFLISLWAIFSLFVFLKKKRTLKWLILSAIGPFLEICHNSLVYIPLLLKNGGSNEDYSKPITSTTLDWFSREHFELWTNPKCLLLSGILIALFLLWFILGLNSLKKKEILEE